MHDAPQRLHAHPRCKKKVAACTSGKASMTHRHGTGAMLDGHGVRAGEHDGGGGSGAVLAQRQGGC